MIKDEQLNLFSCPQKAEKSTVWKLFIDGASRKNPGIAGAGICLFKEAELVGKRGFYLGHKTNNQAEYLALVIGICYFRKYIGSDREVMLYILSDSELLVRQIQGKYKVRDRYLKMLHCLALKLLADFKFSVCHIRREQNTEADEMANHGIDSKKTLPEYLIALLEKHDVFV